VDSDIKNITPLRILICAKYLILLLFAQSIFFTDFYYFPFLRRYYGRKEHIPHA
jgi:hypothetical protein